MIVKIQLRRGLSSVWSSVNPILSSGEFGYETDSKKLKIGDGISLYNDLDYTLNPELIESLVLQAESARDESELSAINALASENSAITSASEALASKDEIVSKIDFTGAVERDLLEQNSVGVYMPKSLKAINQSLIPFSNSPLAGFLDLDNVFVWDSFNRADGNIGTADSGQSWQALGSFSQLSIVGNRALSSINPSYSIINTGFGDVSISASYKVQPDNGLGGIGLLIGKNVDNYFVLKLERNGIRASKIISGNETLILNYSNLPSVDYNLATGNNFDVTTFGLSRSNSRMVIWFNNKKRNILQSVLVTSDLSVFANDSDISFCGVGNFNTSQNYWINNVLIQKNQQ
jgi:hypothetical protein